MLIKGKSSFYIIAYYYIATPTFICVDSLKVHHMSDHMILITNSISWMTGSILLLYNYNRGTTPMPHLPPSMSLAHLAASNALPHEFLFTIEIISGAALPSSLSLPT